MQKKKDTRPQKGHWFRVSEQKQEVRASLCLTSAENVHVHQMTQVFHNFVHV